MLESKNNIPVIADNKFVTQNTFAEHGNEIEEIISKQPPFIVRWGTVYFFFLLVSVGIISWYIQYPDIVVAKARLNSVNAPKAVITKTEGKLVRIVVTEDASVKQGQVLAYMESIANPASVNSISLQLDSINWLIGQSRTDDIVKYFPGHSNQRLLNNLGELQTTYQTFIQSFISFKDFLSDGFFLKKKNMLFTDMVNLQKLDAILANQKTLLVQDVDLSTETFDANKSLAADKVISALDYRNEKSKLIAKQLSLPQINSAIVANESQQNEKRKEIAELENQVLVQKNTFVQALQTMKRQVQLWEFKYLLKAPVDGIVSFAGFFQENQEIKQGQPLFYVQPANTTYFAEMLVPQYNFGKIKPGQKVLLKFQAYPFE